MSGNGWYRPSERLSMREVAEMFGFAAGDEPTQDEAQKARRWLARLESKRGVRVLFGGGAKGASCWTTIEALREAEPGIVEQRRADAEVVDALSEKLEVVDSRVRILASVVSELQRNVAELKPTDERARKAD